jgi:hypothetical protein
MREPEVAAIYMRRRAVAVAVVLGLVVLVVWALSGPSQPAPTHYGPETNTAGFTQLSAAPTTQPTVPAAGEPVAAPSLLPVPTRQPAPPTSSVPPSAAVLPSGSATPSILAATPAANPRVAVPSAAPRSNVVTPSGAGLPSTSAPISVLPRTSPAPTPSPRSPVTVLPPGSTRPSAPTPSVGAPRALAACPDKSIGLVAQVGASSYKVGERPMFRLMISNTGRTACTRDLDAGLQQLVVTTPDGRRVWDSNDCFPARKPDVRTLEPGKPVVFPLSWAGRTSSPGCAAGRTSVGAGTYHLTGKLGALSSEPAPFIMTP